MEVYNKTTVLFDKTMLIYADIMHLSEQYGRRTSLWFHYVPMRNIDTQNTDNIIVDIVKNKTKMINFSVDDINRSHIISTLTREKGEIIRRLRNWEKNHIPIEKKLKSNAERIFVTEDLTKHRHGIKYC